MDDVTTRGHNAELLALVCSALHSLGAGVDPRPQICRDLTELVGSDWSVYVVRQGSDAVDLAGSRPADGSVCAVVEQALGLLDGSGGAPGAGAPPVLAVEAADHASLVVLGCDLGRTAALVLGGDVRRPASLEQAGRVLRAVDGLLRQLPRTQGEHAPADRRLAHVSGQEPPLTADPAALTPREIDVLHLLADGLLARTIAARLRLSPRTVHHHLGKIYVKLGVRDRLGAVLRAREAGLLGERHPSPRPADPLDDRDPNRLRTLPRTVPGSPRRSAAASPAPSS